MQPFRIPLKTRYAETAQDGIIHHSSYVIYFEAARIEYLDSIGCNINEMEKQGFLCPVVSLEAHYLKPLSALQDIIVQVSILSLSKVRFKISHEIFADGHTMARATTLHCFINKLFKPIPIPPQLYSSFTEEMQRSS